MPHRQSWLAIVFLAALVLATRLPMAPGQLLTFDDVNLAYSIGHFDVRVSQPQPPGYPLFVMEMRMLYWLRFRRPEHILLVLGIAGSIAALAILTLFGNRMMGGRAGFYAACMLLFHPVFWQTGVASALRMQLAVISLAVAAACWRAWCGEVRWVLWSAIILAAGAGIRPEIGPLLFPLWAAAALRSPASWTVRGRALAAMAGVVLLWLLPTMISSGGPSTYVRTNLEYVSEQASVSSELFGATQAKALATFWRLIVWTCFGVLGWAMPAVLAWRRKEGWNLPWNAWAFLGFWFVPPFLFALSVHVEDPGQVLSMVPVVSLFGGYLVSRALDRPVGQDPSSLAFTLSLATLVVAWIVQIHWGYFLLLWVPPAAFASAVLLRLDAQISRWPILRLTLTTLVVASIVRFNWGWSLVLWASPAVLATALLVKLAERKKAAYPPRVLMFAYLMAPMLIVNLTAFNFYGWYYKADSASALDQMVADLNTGLELTSREAVEKTLATDDHTLRQVLRLSAERPGNTVIVFGQGMTTWRKAAYYAPSVPVYVLEHKLIRTSPPTLAVWKSNHQETFAHGPAPLRVTLPAGSRIVWLLNPRTEFYGMVRQAFAPTAADTVYFTDLPHESGSRTVGEYELAW